MTALNGIKFVKKDTIDDLETTNDSSLYFAEVEHYGPDASGNWYVLYPNGWIEQGGMLDLGADKTASAGYPVYFLKEMRDINYTPMISMGGNTNSSGYGAYISSANQTRTTTSFSFYVFLTQTSYRYINWEVRGFIAKE